MRTFKVTFTDEDFAGNKQELIEGGYIDPLVEDKEIIRIALEVARVYSATVTEE